MKRFPFALFLLIAGVAHANTLSIGKFGGLDTDNDPLLISAERARDSENVKTDEAFGLGPREGFVQFSTETGSQGPWVFPLSNGTRYLITLSSNVLKATSGGTNFTTIIGTADPTVRVAASPLGDKFYWSTTWGLQHWDATTVTFDSPTLVFDNLVTHKGRLFGSGIPGDKRTIYVSKYLNGADFALRTDPTEDDPARLPVQGSLDENLTVLFASFMDKLIWAKASSFGSITGSRRSAFSLEVISDNVGSAYPETFKDCDGHLRFLGTKRQVWDYDGATLISLTNGKERINELMKTVVQGDANSRSWLQTTQGDWALGFPRVGLDTNTAPGDVAFYAQSTITVPTDDFQDGDYTSSPTWTVYQGSWGVVNGALSSLSYQQIDGMGTDDTIYSKSELSTGTWSWSAQSLSDGHLGMANGEVQYHFMADSIGPQYRSNEATSGGNSYYIRIVGNGTIYFYRRFAGVDTLIISSGASGVAEINVTRSSSAVFTCTYRQNSSAVIPMAVFTDTWIAASKYFIISSFFQVGPLSGPPTNLPYMVIAQIQITTPTYVLISTFTSQTFNIGTTASNWSIFTANSVAGGGSISYGIYSDSNTNIDIDNATTFIASQAIAPGQIPSIKISSYVAVTAYFSRLISTQTMNLNDFTVSWFDGAQTRAASLYVNQRYWLGVAIGSMTNNTVLVYDRNAQWQKWRGINMTGAALYNSDPYFLNASGVFKAESGNTDNGTAITAFYRSKRFLLSGIGYTNYFNGLYVEAANSADTLQTKYYVDGVNSMYSLASYPMNTASGIQDFLLPFATTSLQQGKTIEFHWTVSGTTSWRILGANLDFSPEPVPTGN